MFITLIMNLRGAGRQQEDGNYVPMEGWFAGMDTPQGLEGWRANIGKGPTSMVYKSLNLLKRHMTLMHQTVMGYGVMRSEMRWKNQRGSKST